jgi:arylsulfatase A-like enzyme
MAPPNVVFVFSDQHRRSAMGCAGNEDVQTPNLDRLAAQGTRCSNAYANYAVCSPSRASLLTGQYPQTHGVVKNDLPVPTDAPSIARAFQEQGYRTGYVGKWHVDGWPRDEWIPPGERRLGFDDHWAVYDCSHQYFDAEYHRDSPEAIPIDGYEPVEQTNLAMEFVRESEQPFCLFLSWGPPHDPYREVPERYRDLYDPDELTPRPNVEPILPDAEDHPAPSILDAPPVREYEGEPYPYARPQEGLADYYAAVTALDDQFGRLMDCLEQEGVADETVLTYSSDHGDMFWSHGKNQKGHPYEEASNVPFVVRWPGEIPAGVENRTLLGVVDVAPTLLGLADADVPAAMEGTDLSAHLRGERDAAAGPESVFLMNVAAGWRGVRTDRYTYAKVPKEYMDEHFPAQESGWLLFDNEVDPAQRTNRIYDPEYAAVRERLEKLTDQWIDRLDDPFYADFEKTLAHYDQLEAYREKHRDLEDPE